MVGDDGRWHTYARVKVYLSSGQDTIEKTLVEANGKDKKIKIEKSGIELLLPVGLQSNQGAASPDLSLSERERVGIKPFNNLIKNETSLQK